MNSVVGRRVFVGSVVAGLPLVAGAGAAALAQSGATRGSDGGGSARHLHAGAGGADPVTDYLLRQMAVLHNRMRNGATGEDVRAFASQLRTLVVNARQHDLDSLVTAAVAETIRRERRDVLLLRDPDPEAMRAELERYGFEFDPQASQFALPPDLHGRNRAIDTLLTEGVTPTWERIAAILERGAREIDRRAGGIVRVGLVRQDAEYWVGFCASLWDTYTEAQQIALAACAFMAIPLVGVIVSPTCVALQAGAATTLLMYHYYC